MRYMFALSLIAYACLCAAEPMAPGAPATGEAPAAATVTESCLITLRNGARVSGRWDPVAKKAFVGEVDSTDQVLYREAGEGFVLPKVGGNPAYRTKYELALKNFDRAQQKVTDQAAYFEKNFYQLGLFWDYLTSLDAAYPVVGTKGVGATGAGGGTTLESNKSVQARESFAVLQKHRKERLKWATEIQTWKAKFLP